MRFILNWDIFRTKVPSNWCVVYKWVIFFEVVISLVLLMFAVHFKSRSLRRQSFTNFKTTFICKTNFKAEAPSNKAHITLRRKQPDFLETINSAINIQYPSPSSLLLRKIGYLAAIWALKQSQRMYFYQNDNRHNQRNNIQIYIIGYNWVVL